MVMRGLLVELLFVFYNTVRYSNLAKETGNGQTSNGSCNVHALTLAGLSNDTALCSNADPRRYFIRLHILYIIYDANKTTTLNIEPGNSLQAQDIDHHLISKAHSLTVL